MEEEKNDLVGQDTLHIRVDVAHHVGVIIANQGECMQQDALGFGRVNRCFLVLFVTLQEMKARIQLVQGGHELLRHDRHLAECILLQHPELFGERVNVGKGPQIRQVRAAR